MSIVALFILLAAVIGSTAMVSVIAYLLFRINRLDSGEGGRSQLEPDVERLREELLGVQEEVARLRERVDFTEKLLSPGDDASGGAPPGG